MSYLAIFVISFALLVDEIMLSAVFHVLLGAGNTVTAISIALIGLSAGGIYAYSTPSLNDPARASEVYPKILLWFGILILVSALTILRIPIGHGDLAYGGGSPATQLWRFLAYNVAIVPFFVGGLGIAILLRSEPSRVSGMYFADLAGAALGCIASPALLTTAGAQEAILWGAAPAVLVVSWLGFARRAVPPSVAWIPLALLTGALLRPASDTFATLNTTGRVDAPAYRSFPIDREDLEFERWGFDAWTVIRSDDVPQQWEDFEGWGLSRTYDGPIPRIKLVNYNARFSTYITEFDGDFDEIGAWLDADLSSLHHRLGRSYDSVLNIGAGGGREVLSALQHGAERVVAVDISDVVVNDVMKDHLREFSGDLYLDPRVTAVADEGRIFAERSNEQFDLIDFSIVGGANLDKMDLVRVDDLFTQEALRTYVDRLAEDGVLSYVMYSTRSSIVSELAAPDASISQPYIPALRTLTGLRTAFDERTPEGNFSDHVLIAALPGVVDPSYDLVHILFSRTPFTEGERQRFVELCRELDFPLVYPPPTGEDTSDDLYVRVVEADDLSALSRSLPFSIRPTSDDRPFQYQFDWSHLSRALERGGLETFLAANAFVSLGASVGGLALFVTLIPLIVIRVRTGRRPTVLRRSWRLMLYFACIGYGYMGVEISALLRLQSYLGKPIYGLSVALFAFLLFSGIGSFLSGRIPTERLPRAVYVVVGAILAVGATFLWWSVPLFSGTVHLPLMQRVLVALLAIFPLAFPMGMLFPIGVRLIAGENEELIPWAWATNGCVSVLGIFGTRIIALFVGFSGALVVGLLFYSLVAACVLSHTRAARSAPSLA